MNLDITLYTGCKVHICYESVTPEIERYYKNENRYAFYHEGWERVECILRPCTCPNTFRLYDICVSARSRWTPDLIIEFEKTKTIELCSYTALPLIRKFVRNENLILEQFGYYSHEFLLDIVKVLRKMESKKLLFCSLLSKYLNLFNGIDDEEILSSCLVVHN
jgi:hypothetical protein